MTGLPSSNPAEPIVYVRLLNEGTVVFRPVTGIPVRPQVYQLLAPEGWSPEDEEWEFPPGSIVECEMRNLSTGEVLVAVRIVRVDRL